MHRSLLAGTVVLVAGLGWGPSHATDPRSQTPASESAPPTTAPKYGTEMEWIVGDIVRVIAEGAEAIRSTPSKTVPDVAVKMRPGTAVDLLNSATFEIHVDGKQLEPVVVSQHVWASETFVDLARGLLGTFPGGRSRESARDPRPLIAALTEPRLEVLLAEEGRISAAMAADPRDQVPHEEAALIVAALALREAAGVFNDVRPLLSRATAHLALARALSSVSTPGPSGRLAALVVHALAGREDLAIGELERWPTTDGPSGLAAWKNALRLRVTGDWRQMTVEPSTSLLERLEYARALRERIGSERMLDFLDTQKPDDATDWQRIALHVGWDVQSIESGHRFADAGLIGEVEEIAAVWRHYHDGEPSRDTLIGSLNDDTPAEPRAIDWPTWADTLQRHLCAQLRASARHLSGLGRSRDVPPWLDKASKQFDSLRRFAFVQLAFAQDDAHYHPAVRQTQSIQATRPELVTGWLSADMREKPYYVERAAVFPSDVAWFTPHVPTGTALELEHRSLAFGCDRPVPLPQVERWDSMKPHDMWPARRLVWLRAPGVPAFEDVERALARVIPYDLRVSRHMFESLEATSAQYESVARTMCRLDVDECASLAAQLVADGHEAEGASVYDSYADRARNAVAVANNVGWLVNYYWDTGRHERAAELAEYAGDVGSSTGLEIHGSVLEREGREEEARKVFEHIADRYRSGMALAGYYLRVARRTGDPKWVERAAAAVPKVFPRGIERAEIEWLPAPPTDGMAFVTFGRRAARTGLRASDVVVALDGYRMRTFDQYHVIARGSFEPRMHFIVWRDRKYQRVDADVPQRWLGVWLDNHPTSKPPRLIR